ncbi:hypothetical protein PSACC_00909 [Paramicrosporidium saccamoebae]|uniref:Uncharacterized protein n=1 Tax=Paramicrosporidium saccamoebae TaxID=1246581 RepID=A0A2H9TNM6_9FUNG|nr:hypothetical protein PSACC_00909 [Paramicrosporidium saccamoebae]
MLLASALFPVVSGLQSILNMAEYYALGTQGRIEAMQNLDLTDHKTVAALPEILNTIDPFSVKEDFYARSISLKDASALVWSYFNAKSLHPLLFPLSFVAREPELLELIEKRWDDYTPRYIEYDESQFEKFSNNFRNRLFEMLIHQPSMLKSRIGKISIPGNSDFYWNATDTWNDLPHMDNRELAIISLLDPSSHDGSTEKLTKANATKYYGNGKFATRIELVFGRDPISAHKNLYLILYKRFSGKPAMLAFWHARLVYSILSLPNVNFLNDSVKKRAAVMLKWLLAAYGVELIPPLYLEGIVKILALNKVNCDTNPTSDYATSLVHAQASVPSSASIYGGLLQAAKQWGTFLHQNFAGIVWPLSISTINEAETFWNDYDGDLKHAIPAFTKLPYPINFPTVTCTTVLCLAEESVELYRSAERWSNEEIFSGRASTRLWATVFLHTNRADPILHTAKVNLFDPDHHFGQILATSSFFDYIREELVLVKFDWADDFSRIVTITGVVAAFSLYAISIVDG